MLICLILIGLSLALFIVASIIYYKNSIEYDNLFIFSICGLILISISLSMILIIVHLDQNRKISDLQERHDCLVAKYQLLNEYDGEFTSEMKVLYSNTIKEINLWNYETKDQLENVNNIWINWFFDKDIVESRQLIDIKE